MRSYGADWYPIMRPQPRADEGVMDIVVDSRIMLLGLDGMYRETMKQFETEELLLCAQEVCARLGIGPANDPVEGYYGDTAELRRYWAVCMHRKDEEDPGSLFVDDFWCRELWTTERYRKLQRNKMEMRPISEHGAAHV